MNRGKFIIVLVLIAILATGLAGCSKNTKTSSDDGGTVKELVAKERDKLPKTMPENFPLYKGAKLESSSGRDLKDIYVTWATKDKFKKVADYYKKALPESGFKIDNTSSDEKQVVYSIKKGAGSVIVYDFGYKVTITLVLK
ncbi:MAG: hypothetical protein C4562_04640 [Actinobacteria bacterium]|nr:MAG: hypothetical protein C4562_04640 [Actinomycetota bacterium]